MIICTAVDHPNIHSPREKLDDTGKQNQSRDPTKSEEHNGMRLEYTNGGRNLKYLSVNSMNGVLLWSGFRLKNTEEQQRESNRTDEDWVLICSEKSECDQDYKTNERHFIPTFCNQRDKITYESSKLGFVEVIGAEYGFTSHVMRDDVDALSGGRLGCKNLDYACLDRARFTASLDLGQERVKPRLQFFMDLCLTAKVINNLHRAQQRDQKARQIGNADAVNIDTAKGNNSARAKGDDHKGNQTAHACAALLHDCVVNSRVQQFKPQFVYRGGFGPGGVPLIGGGVIGGGFAHLLSFMKNLSFEGWFTGAVDGAYLVNAPRLLILYRGSAAIKTENLPVDTSAEIRLSSPIKAFMTQGDFLVFFNGGSVRAESPKSLKDIPHIDSNLLNSDKLCEYKQWFRLRSRSFTVSAHSPDIHPLPISLTNAFSGGRVAIGASNLQKSVTRPVTGGIFMSMLRHVTLWRESCIRKMRGLAFLKFETPAASGVVEAPFAVFINARKGATA